jgi:hypothetical protein
MHIKDLGRAFMMKNIKPGRYAMGPSFKRTKRIRFVMQYVSFAHIFVQDPARHFDHLSSYRELK